MRKGRLPWPAPSFLRSRPLLCGTVAFLAGILLAMRAGYSLWLWVLGGGLTAGATALRFSGRLRRAVLPLACAAMLALGMARGGMALDAPALPPTGDWTVEGTVNSRIARSERGVWFYVRDVRVQTEADGPWTPIDGNLYCYYATTSATRLAYGQRVAISGTSYLPNGARNPGGFDQRMWMAQQGAHVRMYAERAPVILAPAGFSVRGLAIAINESLGARMDALFGQASPLVRAVLLGDQSDVPEDWSDWMRDSGIIHLLAVSGLHVALWFVLLERLIRPLPVSPPVRWLLLLLILSAYALVTGLKPSVLRAVVMLLCAQGARVARRKPDTLTSLALAALLILIARPLDLYSAGFQLSFCAVLGLVLVRPALLRLLPIRRDWIREPLCTTVAAQIGILPALSLSYRSISIIGVIVNVIAVPLAGLMIPVAALATLLDAVWAPLGYLLAEATRGMVAVVVMLSRIASRVPYATVPVGAFAWWTAAAYGLALFLCCSAVTWRWRRRVAAFGVAVVLAVCIGFLSGSFWIRYVQLDVGQALSGVLHVGRATYVYDTGNPDSDLTEYLSYRGSTVDGLFLSHPHTDHTGGLTELLEAGIAVRTVYVPAQAEAFGAEPLYGERLEAARRSGAEIVEVAAGDVLDLGGVRATVVAPPREVLRGSDPNDRSIVLLLEAGGHTLLLMGDADGAAEPLGVDTDVLQVAHHGSRNAAGEAFLQDATPEIALISVGRNTYGHPHDETLERLAEAGADIYLTQESGALTVYFTPNDIRVEAYIP